MTDENEVALEQCHIAPLDDGIEHVISAFCPCNPELETGPADDDEGDGIEYQVITYRHKTVGVFRCVCSGQGSIYSSGCPLHDPSVDTHDSGWLKWYENHLENQRRIKRNLGW